MTAAQTKEHEEDKHTGMAEKMRNVGGKTQKQENCTQGVYIVTNLPVSATKPRRGPCHTICHLPAFVGNGMKSMFLVITITSVRVQF